MLERPAEIVLTLLCDHFLLSVSSFMERQNEKTDRAISQDVIYVIFSLQNCQRHVNLHIGPSYQVKLTSRGLHIKYDHSLLQCHEQRYGSCSITRLSLIQKVFPPFVVRSKTTGTMDLSFTNRSCFLDFHHYRCFRTGGMQWREMY